MWTRVGLKIRARQNLGRYFSSALLVSFIANLFSSNGGGGGGRSATGVNVGSELTKEFGLDTATENLGGLEGILADIPGSVDSLMEMIDPVVMSVVASVLVIAAVIGFVLAVFLAPMFLVGKNRFYMESRLIGQSAGVEKLFWGFKHGYLNIVWTMFLKKMIVFIGTLFFIVPGIYFGYCFYMVPYILAENPDMPAGEVLRMSKDMMVGQKLRTFLLEVSFWGWWILGSMVCGVGTVLVLPYYDATFAELYAVLRNRFRNNLNGFGREEVEFEQQDPYFRNGGYDDVTQQQYAEYSERNEYESRREESSGQRYAESSRDADYGYYERTESSVWSESQTVVPESDEQEFKTELNRSEVNKAEVNKAEVNKAEINKPEVNKAEGTAAEGHGRGYYLNGVFYPYTEEELRQLEENKHKN